MNLDRRDELWSVQNVEKKWEKSDILQRNMWKNIVDTFFKEEYNMSEWNRKIKSKTLRKEDAYAIWLYYREL